MRRCWSILWLALTLINVASCQDKAATPSKKAYVLQPGTTIFLDTSMSIRGYFRTSSQDGTMIQRFMLADLLPILAENNLMPVDLSTFGSEVAPPRQINSLREWTLFPSKNQLEGIYSQTTTNLIGVFQSETFAKTTLTIIITDGLQSDARGSSSNIEGFDPRLFNIINDKKNSGQYLSLIGVKSEFNGYLYPEHPNTRGERTSFPHPGPRPIYIWIASHDHKLGAELSGKIINRLQAIADSPDRVKSASITSLDPPVINLTLNTELSLSPIKVKEIDKTHYEWLIARTQDAEIHVPIDVERSEINAFSDLEWHTDLELQPTNTSWAELVKEEGNWNLKIHYRRVPSSGLLSGNSEIAIVANVTPKSIQNPWWYLWNTDNDSNPKDGDKTFYLKKLGPTIDTLLNKKYEAEKIVLRIRTP